MDKVLGLLAHIRGYTDEERMYIFRQLTLGATDEQREVIVTTAFELMKPDSQARVASAIKTKDDERKSEEFKPCRDVAALDAKYTWPTLLPPHSLMNHQKTAVDWMLKRFKSPNYGVSGGLLHLEMGLGKTLIALATMAMMQRDAGVPQGPSIYICDLILLQTASEDTLKFFGSSMNACVFHPDFIGKHRFNNFNPNVYNLIFTTYDTILALHKKGSTVLSSVPWFIAVADESQRIRNSSTKTYDAMMSIRARHRMCLTGTAIVNGAGDLEPQLRWLGLSPDITYNAANFEALKFKDVLTLSMSKDEELGSSLPPVKYETVSVALNQSEDTLRRILMGRTENILRTILHEKGMPKDRRTVTHIDLLTTITRLRLACISPYLLLKASRAREDSKDKDAEQGLDQVMLPTDGSNYEQWNQWIASAANGMYSSKMNAVINLIRSFPPDDKVLVFSCWVSPLVLLSQRIKAEGAEMPLLTGETKDQHGTLKMFELGTNRVMGLTYGSGSKGLNIVCANRVIILEPGWNRTHEQQAAARVHRIGQTKPVHVYLMCCDAQNTIESYMHKTCDDKEEAIKSFFGDDGAALSKFVEWSKT